MIPGTEAEAARLDSLVQKALAVEPNDLRARFAKGLLDLTHGRYDQALVEFERVLTSNSSDVGAYGNIGWIYMATGQEDKAIAVFDKAMAAQSARSQPALLGCTGRLWRWGFWGATRKHRFWEIRP